MFLAAVAAKRRRLTKGSLATDRRRRVGPHFVLQRKGHLGTEGLTGTSGWGDLDWLTGGLHNGIGYIFLARKVGIAHDQLPRPPWIGRPRFAWCPRP